MEGGHAYRLQWGIRCCLLILVLLVSQTGPLTTCKAYANNICKDNTTIQIKDCITCVYAKTKKGINKDKHYFPTCVKPGLVYRRHANLTTLCSGFDLFFDFVCCKAPNCATIDREVFSRKGKRGCIQGVTTPIKASPIPTTTRARPPHTTKPILTSPTPTKTRVRPPHTTKPIRTIIRYSRPPDPADVELLMDTPTKWPIMKCYGYSENGTVVIFHMCYGCVITTVYRHAEPPWLDCIRPLQTIYEPHSQFCNQYFLDNHILIYVKCCYSELCNKSSYVVAGGAAFLHSLGLHHAAFFLLFVTLTM